MISAANNIANEKEKINSLNVFPVPDGDTGINMSLTMQSAKKALADYSGDLTSCADLVANSLLRGGRGNSGVILSLFFRGVAKGLKGKKEANTAEIAAALKMGVESAYKAVRHPTEGTILTVVRMCATRAEQIAAKTTEMPEFFMEILSQAKETLAQTPEMLPVLKQANVVDAGGRGIVSIFSGIVYYLNKEEIVLAEENADSDTQGATFDQFDTKDIKFQYCTECIVDKAPDVQPSALEAFESLVMGIGDSQVFVNDAEAGIIKVHVHTNDPGRVLSSAVTCGSLATVKVENMKNQHTNLVAKQNAEVAPEEPKHVKRVPEKRYGFVSVAAGAGLVSVFRDIGVDCIVEGGQTMNPSTDDIIAAVDETPAEIVYVLPNNKNIYMAAKQAEGLVTDKKVIVIRTTSVPQGISAVLAFNEELDVEQNTEVMIDAVKSVRTAKMTFAARDSVYSDKVIKEGQMLGMVENDVRYVCDTKEECMENLVSEMTDASYITVFYGEDVSEDEATKMSEFIKPRIGDAEISFVNGGQPVYYYIISAE